MIINQKFAFKIPDGIPPEKAGPLLCAGTTVWESIVRYVINQPCGRLGILGFGGLGHMALKFASVLKVETWVLTTTPGKRDKAIALGATECVCISDVSEAKKAAQKFDVIIDTAPDVERGDMTATMDMLAFGGTLVKVGLPPATFSYHWVPLVFTGRGIVASIVCGSKNTKKMLEFCAENKILPEVDIVPFSQLPTCMESLVSRKNGNFRYVLSWDV